MVLFLGNSHRVSPWASWDELQDALLFKFPDISKNKLRQIVNANKGLFSVVSGGVLLLELDHDFVREYFELAEDVEVLEHQTNASYSLSESIDVDVGNTIRVAGMVCAKSVSRRGEAVLFKFGDSIAYRLENMLDDYYNSGELLRSELKIRQVVNINVAKHLSILHCF